MLPYEHGGDIYGGGEIRLDFSVNINPLGMPPGVKRAVAEHMGDYARYPDPHCRRLCAAIARACSVPESSVLCGNGAADLLLRFCACLRPRRVLTLAPTFSEYARTAELFGGEVREHRLLESQGFALTEAVLSDIAGIDAVFLCNPNNPTGQLAPLSLIRQAAEECRKCGALLLVDECFLDFTDGESAIPLLAEYPNLLILRAFTKIYAMAGLRLGYLLCADKELLSRIAVFGAPWSVSAPAQAAGPAALGTPGWIEETRRFVTEERVYLTRALAELGLAVLPGDANFLLIKSETPLHSPLRARGILVRACDNFTGLNARFIRVGLKTHKENEALICAMREAIHG
ncbi:MAG: threonine-phosphate decarboxylase CobD [Clostridiaceae bacterium]|nr:threonine-phosphate decarboxylase CobD [Clostridiaceae bacterium]